MVLILCFSGIAYTPQFRSCPVCCCECRPGIPHKQALCTEVQDLCSQHPSDSVSPARNDHRNGSCAPNHRGWEGPCRPGPEGHGGWRGCGHRPRGAYCWARRAHCGVHQEQRPPGCGSQSREALKGISSRRSSSVPRHTYPIVGKHLYKSGQLMIAAGTFPAGVVDATEPERREDLVFIQNGMLQ